jgi:hypothetical protein
MVVRRQPHRGADRGGRARAFHSDGPAIASALAHPYRAHSQHIWRSGRPDLLAGDWTDCGLNAGCEAAVLSGLEAATR